MDSADLDEVSSHRGQGAVLTSSSSIASSIWISAASPGRSPLTHPLNDPSTLAEVRVADRWRFHTPREPRWPHAASQRSHQDLLPRPRGFSRPAPGPQPRPEPPGPPSIPNVNAVVFGGAPHPRCPKPYQRFRCRSRAAKKNKIPAPVPLMGHGVPGQPLFINAAVWTSSGELSKQWRARKL